jgi:hypothetical protein
VLISTPVLRTTCEYGNHVHIICAYTATVGVIEQKDINMVNSGARGRKKMNLRTEVCSAVS